MKKMMMTKMNKLKWNLFLLLWLFPLFVNAQSVSIIAGGGFTLSTANAAWVVNASGIISSCTEMAINHDMGAYASGTVVRDGTGAVQFPDHIISATVSNTIVDATYYFSGTSQNFCARFTAKPKSICQEIIAHNSISTQLLPWRMSFTDLTYSAYNDIGSSYGSYSPDCLFLANGYCAGIVAGTTAYVEKLASTYSRIYAKVPPIVPCIGTYSIVGSSLAFFVCPQGKYLEYKAQAEEDIGIPSPSSRRMQNAENYQDYLFVTTIGSATDELINTIRRTKVKGILLLVGTYLDTTNPSKPFCPIAGATDLISLLHQEGVSVGLHIPILYLPVGSYYPTAYASSMYTGTIASSYRRPRWENNITETMAHDWAGRFRDLQGDWLFLDNQESLFNTAGTTTVTTFDNNLRLRFENALTKEFIALGISPKVWQSSSVGSNGYQVSRRGYIDYYSGNGASVEAILQGLDGRAVMYGWMGIPVDYGWSGYWNSTNYFTVANWEHIFASAYTYHAPIGIETAMALWTTNPIKDWIEDKLRNYHLGSQRIEPEASMLRRKR